LLDQLRRIVGAPHVLTGVECSPYVVDGPAPTSEDCQGAVQGDTAVPPPRAELRSPRGLAKMWIGSPPNWIGLVLALKRLIASWSTYAITVTVEAGLTFDRLQAERAGAVARWIRPRPTGRPSAASASDAPGPRRHLSAPRATW
jgi:hypothetical protein